jgi:outer membrane protein assembly factor BamA
MIQCLLLLLVAVLNAAGGTPVVRSIEIEGNQHMPTQDVVSWLSLRPPALYSAALLDSDLASVTAHYISAGYLNCCALVQSCTWSSDSSQVDIAITVREGPRTVVRAITVTGSRVLSAPRLLEHFDLHAGMPFDRALLEGDIAELLRRYEKLGFPFARCEVGDLRLVDDSTGQGLEVDLVVDEGRRFTIDEIRVEGNTETDPSVVVRETRLVRNELFDPVKVGKIRDRLRRLNIFSEVDEPILFIRDTVGGLNIRVREGNTNTFDGIIGYIPSGSDQPGYVNGLASVTMRNVFGTGRKLSFRWQREDRYSQEIGVQYLEPWVLGQPVNLGGGFQQRQQDSSYVTRDVSMKAELMLSEDLSVSLLFGTTSVIPSTTAGVVGISRSRSTSGGAEILYDTRNDNYSPTSGARYRTDYSYGRRTIAGTSTLVQHLTIDLDFYLSTFSRQVLAMGLHGREIQGEAPEESELYRFGGARTLRGYRENQFIGSRIAWSNTEYRFLLARKSFLYGFIDTGYYYRPADSRFSIAATDGLKLGYGIGIQLATDLGVMGVSFALGEGDSFSTAKIHFGLNNDF